LEFGIWIFVILEFGFGGQNNPNSKIKNPKSIPPNEHPNCRGILCKREKPKIISKLQNEPEVFGLIHFSFGGLEW